MPSLRCSTSFEQPSEEKLYITFYSDPGAGHFDHALRQNNEGFCRWCVGGFRYNHLRVRYGTNQRGSRGTQPKKSSEVLRKRRADLDRASNRWSASSSPDTLFARIRNRFSW